MNLLKLASEENLVNAYPDPHSLQIKEFKEINDKSDKPERIYAYIYHMHNNDSAYSNYALEKREEEVKLDLFGDKDYTLSDIEKRGEEKYIELTTTPEQRLLEKAVSSVYKLMDYLDAFNPTERDENGKLVWSTKDYIRNMEKLSGVVDSLEDLRERVKKGEGSQGDIRGDTKVTKYNK